MPLGLPEATKTRWECAAARPGEEAAASVAAEAVMRKSRRESFALVMAREIVADWGKNWEEGTRRFAEGDSKRRQGQGEWIFATAGLRARPTGPGTSKHFHSFHRPLSFHLKMLDTPKIVVTMVVVPPHPPFPTLKLE